MSAFTNDHRSANKNKLFQSFKNSFDKIFNREKHLRLLFENLTKNFSRLKKFFDKVNN